MTYGSLFTGIGGLDLGLDRAGFECRWQVEIDPYAVKVLEKHWPNVARYGDITKLTGDELEPVDAMCGGFPCQDLSQAGKQVGITGSRSGLWFEFARLIGVVRPRYVLIENVPGILVPGAMRRVVGELARLRYVGVWRSLRASEFGASHLRKRVFIVAYRSGERRQQDAGGPFGDEAAHGRARRDIREPDGDYLTSGDRADVAYGPLRGLGILREPSGSNGLVNGSHEELGDSQRTRWTQTETGRHEHAGPEPEEGMRELDDSLRTGLEVGDGKRELQIRGDSSTLAPGLFDAELAYRSGDGCGGHDATDETRGIESVGHPGQTSDDLGQFAPGPSDPRWPYILRERPDLAPALESPLCRMVDGIPTSMDGDPMSNRTKRLGRLGNAVVPQISEWIGQRILEFERSYA